jgi:hypothetical protein
MHTHQLFFGEIGYEKSCSQCPVKNPDKDVPDRDFVFFHHGDYLLIT